MTTRPPTGLDLKALYDVLLPLLSAHDSARVQALREPDLNTRVSDTLNALYHPHQD